MNAVTEVEEALRGLASRLQKEGEQRVKLVEACKLVLLFHSGSAWDDEKKMEWANGLTVILGTAAGRDPKVVGANGDGTWDGACPTNEATTKNLCNAVRAALGVQ